MRGTILFVDDHPGVCSTVAEYLSKQGYEVVTAPAAAEALKILQSSSTAIELLITDLHLPGMEGDELARRAKELRPELKALFISGSPKHQARVPPEELLEKPFRFAGLLEKIEEILGQGRI